MPAPATPKLHFFVSYTQADRPMAEWIAWQLEAAGYTVVIQAWHFRPGQDFVQAMDDAAKQADRTLAVLSPAYLRSQFAGAEWRAAFARDPSGARGLLLPVRVQPCQPEGLLGQIVYIDLVGLQDKDTARQRLLAGIDLAARKPLTEPDLPPLVAGAAVPPARPEPAWVAHVEAGAEVAGRALWRVLRVAALALGGALGAWLLLGQQFHAWQEEAPSDLAFTAGVLGIAAAVAVESVLRAWQRRRPARP
jgi:hypothetical protein